ncbi:DUF6283 family protein [Spirillospora sp. CA-294931]|uniref:DUF6283 family protein n=1 Tax=Spirillospora sp. CA-294931 TaxID=3240042 RepID=UPI003D8B8009
MWRRSALDGKQEKADLGACAATGPGWQAAAVSAMPRRLYPCDECPVRADNIHNPCSKFPAERWDELRASIDDGNGGSAPLGAILFGCHKGQPGTGADLACAGWLAAFGDRSVAVRLAIAQGRLDPEALRPGTNWPPLHESWDEMAEAQLWLPGDPDDHLLEAFRREQS